MEMDYSDILITIKWIWQGMFLLFACCGFIALVTFGMIKIAKLKKK